MSRKEVHSVRDVPLVVGGSGTAEVSDAAEPRATAREAVLAPLITDGNNRRSEEALNALRAAREKYIYAREQARSASAWMQSDIGAPAADDPLRYAIAHALQALSANPSTAPPA